MPMPANAKPNQERKRHRAAAMKSRGVCFRSLAFPHRLIVW
jgi:hypothetical protein